MWSKMFSFFRKPAAPVKPYVSPLVTIRNNLAEARAVLLASAIYGMTSERTARLVELRESIDCLLAEVEKQQEQQHEEERLCGVPNQRWSPPKECIPSVPPALFSDKKDNVSAWEW